jgi:hypothetical protein
VQDSSGRLSTPCANLATGPSRSARPPPGGAPLTRSRPLGRASLTRSRSLSRRPPPTRRRRLAGCGRALGRLPLAGRRVLFCAGRFLCVLAVVCQDWLSPPDPSRNGPGATIVAPYSPRARPEATVSFPVVPKELGSITPGDFDVTSVPRLLKRPGPRRWSNAVDEERVRLPASLLRD